MDISKRSPEIKQYFESLPASLQETLIQSGAKIDSLEQLQKLAAEFQNKQ